MVNLFIFFLVIFLGVLFIKGSLIVRQAEVIIIERLGRFYRILNPGFHWIIPFMDRPRELIWKVQQRDEQGHIYRYNMLRSRIDLRETIYDFPRQDVITKDNVRMGIDALIYFQVINPKNVTYEIGNLPEAIEKLTQTTMRNIVGEMDLDETFVSRDKINDKLRKVLDEASEKWGIKVNRVELQDIIPPEEIQVSMDKQMKAERDKRASILEAEGLKQAAVLRAEGEQQAAILVADGQAQARVKQAEGEAEALNKVIKAIGPIGPADQYMIAMKYLETLKQMVEGKDNKVIYLPIEATGILSSLAGIKQIFKTGEN